MPLSRYAQPFAAEAWPFAVVDGCAAPGLGARIRALGGAARSLFGPPSDADLAAAAPYVVRLGAEVATELRELGNLPWGMWIDAAGDLDQLRHHLRRWLSVRSPDGEIWLFRFYDPRILPRFLEASTPTEHAALFGPIRKLGLPGPDAMVATIGFSPEFVETGAARIQVGRLSGKHAAGDATPPPSKLFALRPPHLEAFREAADAALVERIRSHLEIHYALTLGGLDRATVGARIRAALARARGHGIAREDALTAFVGLAFQVGPRFDQHPVIERCLGLDGETADDRILGLGQRTSLAVWDEAARLPDEWEGESR